MDTTSPQHSLPLPTFTPPHVLSPRAFHAAIAGVIGLNQVYELLKAGRLRHLRVGSRYLILATETRDFFEREALLAEVRR